MAVNPRTTWSAGHGLGSRNTGQVDPGAVSKYGVEATEVRALTRNLAQDTAATKVPTLFRDKGYYALADNQAHGFDSGRFAEIHLNSGPSSAHGVEVLVGPNASSVEKKWAHDTASGISAVLGIPNRGVKVRDDLAVLHQYQDMASILVEVVFVSNRGDMTEFHAKSEALELTMLNAYRESIGRKRITYLPRKTWRKVRIQKYLKTV